VLNYSSQVSPLGHPLAAGAGCKSGRSISLDQPAAPFVDHGNLRARITAGGSFISQKQTPAHQEEEKPGSRRYQWCLPGGTETRTERLRLAYSCRPFCKDHFGLCSCIQRPVAQPNADLRVLLDGGPESGFRNDRVIQIRNDPDHFTGRRKFLDAERVILQGHPTTLGHPHGKEKVAGRLWKCFRLSKQRSP
jgi:hypothetical protein